MQNNSFGENFIVTTFGESHGIMLGAVIDGCPAGLSLSEEDIQEFLDMRKPGNSKVSTPRKESDKARIVSGVFDGVTTGTPITVLVENENQNSKDYSDIKDVYRPGHADYTFDKKYGFRDYRGGGRSSGRETIGRVIAGAIANKILKELGISIDTYTQAIGDIEIGDVDLSMLNNDLYMPDKNAYLKAMDYIETVKLNNDSCGGVIECVVHGVPAGVGEPVFNKLDAMLAKAMLSIGAVKGFEIGDGFDVTTKLGSNNNDEFVLENDNDNNLLVTTKTNHAGGVLGGISNGADIVFRVPIKPTPSISKQQNSINNINEEIKLEIKGRHDPIIVPRAVVVVKSMTAITLVDLLMENMKSQMKNLKDFYRSN